MACITRTITGNSYFTVFLDYDIIAYATETGGIIND